MKYTHAAHPTEYAGVLFRSRLEAHWAAFFDELGWHWEYEPFDLPGWVPDFSIYGTSHDRILVEVKPFLGLKEEPTEYSNKKDPVHEDVKSVLRQIDAALPAESEVLLVGADLIYPTEGHDALGPGLLREAGQEFGRENGEWYGRWQEASFCVGEHPYLPYDFGVVPSLGSYHARVSNNRDGDSGSPRCVGSRIQGEEKTGYPYKVIMDAWAVSKNKTQWKPE